MNNSGDNLGLAVEVAKKQGRFMYSNAIGITSNLFDFQFTFDTVEAEPGGEFGKVEESFVVVMSPQRAKMLCASMLISLKQYEDKEGEIKIPSEE